MRVALVSTYFEAEAIGLRMLSSVLRRAGHETELVFLPKQGDGVAVSYPEAVERDVVDLCRGVDAVGMTLMSNNFLTAQSLTRRIQRETGVPVVWGGVHPTVRPEESLETADWVCVGEGEDALLEFVETLARGDDPVAVENLWCRRGDDVVRNPSRPLIQDLDSLPYGDYSLEDHHIIDGGRVVPMTPSHLERVLLYRYATSSSRGCILNCSFCCHNAYRRLYGAKAGNTRRRSVDHVLGELRWVREHLPYVRFVLIDDDSFMDAPVEYIAEFALKYEADVALPFMVTGVIPINVTADKVAHLVRAGLTGVRMGIQSGAQNTKRLYRRNIKDSVILRAACTFDEHRSQIRLPNYDLILDNPWETDEDRTGTIELLRALPRPFIITYYSLTFYPGTDLYDRARQEGLIRDDVEDVYKKDYLEPRRTYMNGLAYLFGAYRLPDPVARLLMHSSVVRRQLDFLFWPLWALGWPTYLVVRAVRHLQDGNYARVVRWARLGASRARVRLAGSHA